MLLQSKILFEPEDMWYGCTLISSNCRSYALDLFNFALSQLEVNVHIF